jgi:transposase
MVSLTSIVAKVTKAKGMHIVDVDLRTRSVTHNGISYEFDELVAHVRPYQRMQCMCPCCKVKRPIYDHKAKHEVTWRGPDWAGMHITLLYQPVRINCPVCGVKTEYIPWQDGDSHFLATFNNEVAYMALNTPKTVVAQFFGISWETVGNCIKAVHSRLEPSVDSRLKGVRRIAVDETSYEKGHKYITVVYDLDKNQVIWLHKGHSEEVFSLFCEALDPEDMLNMEVVAGDGARWIDSCKKRYFPNAIRCVDFFHIVSWITAAMDRVRIDASNHAQEELERRSKEYENRKKQMILQWKQMHKAYLEAQKLISTNAHKRGRRSNELLAAIQLVDEFEKTYGKDSTEDEIQLTEEQKEELDRLKVKAGDLKQSKYVFGKNPENLTQRQIDKLNLIRVSNEDVYRAYMLKEQLRAIVHMKDPDLAEAEIDNWKHDTEASGIAPFVELAEKIGRHKENILNAIRLQVNSAKSEATNTTIKAIIIAARGFRNLNNLYALVYLRCSDLVVPLDNRYIPSRAEVRQARELANMRRKEREANNHNVA